MVVCGLEELTSELW